MDTPLIGHFLWPPQCPVLMEFDRMNNKTNNN